MTQGTEAVLFNGVPLLAWILASNPDVHFEGEKAVVHVSIPILIPRLPSGRQAEGDADMPNTG